MTVEATPEVVNMAGASATKGRMVGDRQKTAQRLLRSTAERAYNPELDIDWDQPLADDKRWLPPHRQTMYGTKTWDAMSEDERDELGRHEAVAILSFGLYAEVGLSMMLMRAVLENPDLVDDHCRYALAEVGEETRHSTMFSRLVNKTGLEPYTYPKSLLKLVRLVGLVPLGPASYAGTLLIEEVLDRLQREASADESIQPHFRQLMKIHVLEEARHITYAREEMVRSMEAHGKVYNAIHRGAFAVMVFGVLPALVTPKVYRSTGIGMMRGLIESQLSPEYRKRAVFAGEPLLRFCYEAGFIKGRVSTRILIMSRSLPSDVVDEIKRSRKRSVAA
ncbi:AurF N-oxygenase family protein [Gordonia sp. CPCC 205333]|uniref:AurF N-oxygenase family protein n=1 Tax=Gordonia sp. CPCC 205333 TaxID=3140790 RepID=UPI003AF40703